MPITTRQLIEVEAERLIAARVEVADTAWKRAVGLLGRASLPPDGGLWLEPCNGVHTFVMRFPLDLLILNRQGEALRVVAHLSPNRWVGPIRGARVVVELPAGTLAARNVAPGQRYRLV